MSIFDDYPPDDETSYQREVFTEGYWTEYSRQKHLVAIGKWTLRHLKEIKQRFNVEEDEDEG